MTRPATSPAQWATDANYAPGAENWANTATRIVPTLGIVAKGQIPGLQLGAQHYNYLLGSHGDWLAYLEEKTNPALNWPERPTFANTSTVNSKLPMAWDPAPSSQGYGGNTGLFMCVTANTNSVTSDDGSVWGNAVSFGGILGAAAFDLAAGLSNGVRSFLASKVGGTAVMRTIDAGTTWSVLGSTVPINANLCNGPGSFWVAAGDAGAIKHSTDGLTWTNAGQTVPGGWVFPTKRIVWNGSLYVILASGATSQCLTSPDGLVWTMRGLGSSQTWHGLAYSAAEGLWMAVAESGSVVVSPDAVTWTPRSVPPVGMVDLAVIGSVWVAPVYGGQFGGINYSTDRGVTWRQVAVGNHRVANGWSRIIAADNRFIVGHATGAQLEFALSQRTA